MNDDHWTPKQSPNYGNVEVRVIGGGSWRNRQPQAPEPEGEQVVRLESNEVPMAVKSVDEMEPTPEGVVLERRKKRRLGLGGLTGWMAAGAVVMAVTTVAAVMVLRDDVNREGYWDNLNVAKDEEQTALGSLSAKSVDYYEDAVAIVESYRQAKGFEDVVPLIRNGEQLRPLLAERWEPLVLGENEVDKLDFGILGSSDKAWLTLSGRDSMFRRLVLAFVPEDGVLLMDWEASMGIGDRCFEDMNELEMGAEVEMRVLVTVARFYDLNFPDDEYDSYRLHDPLREQHLWAYVKKDSAASKALADHLYVGSLILDSEGREGEMILRLKNTGSAASGQFEVVDVVETAWVKP